MPTTFSAWNVRHYGGPEVLAPVTRPIEAPAPTEIQIRIRASAVTRADGMMRAGQPKFARLFLGLSRPRAGLVGTCLSGDVVAVGDQVTRFEVGDAVFGEAGMNFGANATHINLDQDGVLMKKPQTLSYDEAAVMCDGPLTSWHFLTSLAQVKPGAHVLILGGAGSLGSAAVQIAKALGATVAATCSARNAKMVSELGADRVIDYNTAPVMEKGANYDIIFDTLGISSFKEARPALADRGEYICPVLGLALFRDMFLGRFFTTKRARFAAAGLEKPALLRTHLEAILASVERGEFAPVMDRSYPLADLVEAHHYVETGHKRGNVVVV